LLPWQIASIFELSRTAEDVSDAIALIKEKNFDAYYTDKSREYYKLKAGINGSLRVEMHKVV
jgi:hypothetical protein